MNRWDWIFGLGTLALLASAGCVALWWRSVTRVFEGEPLTPVEEAQRSEAERLAEKVPAPDGWTLALHWGKSGGWWFRRGYAPVLCMGRLALTWIPRDLHPMLRDLAGRPRWSPPKTAPKAGRVADRRLAESATFPTCPGSYLLGNGPGRFYCTRCDAEGDFIKGFASAWCVPCHAPVGEPR